ncbi:hypothetical protein ACFU9W_04045 [Streptomyces sp. NPDC057600]|uniref:hypothetical protein n=1 Tax=Streptomyces sp. NPDC057600 TaxID=3346180 RepID=UPI0036BC1CCC
MAVAREIETVLLFLSGLGMPDPDAHPRVDSGSCGVRTDAALSALDPVLDAEHP